MGKKKKKQQQQQPAFKPRAAAVFNVFRSGAPVVQNRTLTTLPVQMHGPVRGHFQAPHHQQESMVELSDDTSPNTPLATTSGGWKPITPVVATPSKIAAPKEIKKTKQEQIWRDFKEGLTTTPIHKIGCKVKEVKTTGNQQKPSATVVTKEQKKPPSKQEIKWELNVLEDKEETAVNTDKTDVPVPTPVTPDMLQPKVVQGTAAEIKLITSKDRPALVNIAIQDEPNTSTAPLQQKPVVNRKKEQEIKAALAAMYNYGTHPKGIPRSFLLQQKMQEEFGGIQPQTVTHPSPSPMWNVNQHGAPPALAVQTSLPNDSVEEQQYSPSAAYTDGQTEQAEDGSVSPEAGKKRLSAFHRLGPVSEPKKPKLTINLLCTKEQSVRREVLEDEVETYTPVHLRKDVIESCDETVMKYLSQWPWKRNVGVRKTVSVRNSKSVMILEQEQMEEYYEKDNMFVQVVVSGYPRHWKKEHVLDVLLESVKGKSFIPCFIEFTQEKCKFLVIRNRLALVYFHKLGFYIRKDDVELCVSISQVDLSLNQIDFIPRLVLRKQLSTGYDGERKLSLKEFTLKSDVSHFIYFPLNRVTNQMELVQIQSTVAWNYLTDLDLSHNRITSVDGFELPKTTPKLKHLDLSHNLLERVSGLLYCRQLALRSLRLEGNPLCHDYTDPSQYVRVVKMIFSALTEIDGVPIHLKGDLPKAKRNYCPIDAEELAGKFLEVFFPLLEAPHEDRHRIEEMYDDQAVLTVTYRYGLRYSPIHRKFRNIFLRARVFDEGDAESIEGAASIAKLLGKWPMLRHDPYTFTLDVLHHSENSTILRLDGILKLTSDTLADDEPLLAFTRTLVLTTQDGVEYKILNEMLFWDEPTREMANAAFQFNTIQSSKRPSLKLDYAPDEEFKRKLTEIFMQITEADEKSSERCLELKEWNIKSSIEYYMKLVKLDDLNSLRME